MDPERPMDPEPAAAEAQVADPAPGSGAAAPGEDAGPGGTAAAAPRRGFVARWWWAIGIGIAAVVALLASAFASPDPDGLDSVAIQQGFEKAAKPPAFELLPGYSIPGLDGAASTAVAGVVGIGIVLLLVVLLGRLLARRRRDRAVPR